MRFLLFLISALVVALSFIDVCLASTWIKWGPTPGEDGAYTVVPLTTAEITPPWEKADDFGLDMRTWNLSPYCYGKDPVICPIYNNRNGHLYGIQVGFNAVYTDPDFMLNRPYVNKIFRNGIPIYMYTILFVSEVFGPSWSGSITNGLYVATWMDNATPTGLIKVPMKRSEMLSSGFTKHQCVNLMGQHYFLNMTIQNNCWEIVPIFPVFDGSKTVGFGILNLYKKPTSDNEGCLMEDNTTWNEVEEDYPNPWSETPPCFDKTASFVTHIYVKQNSSIPPVPICFL